MVRKPRSLEALGEALVPGARAAGVAHFIDQQISVPPGEALLEARIVNIKPPFVNFYRAAIGAIEKASMLQSHDRPISDDILSGGRQGWPAILSNLKSVLETGSAMTIPMKPPQRMLDALKAMGIKTPM